MTGPGAASRRAQARPLPPPLSRPSRRLGTSLSGNVRPAASSLHPCPSSPPPSHAAVPRLCWLTCLPPRSCPQQDRGGNDKSRRPTSRPAPPSTLGTGSCAQVRRRRRRCVLLYRRPRTLLLHILLPAAAAPGRVIALTDTHTRVQPDDRLCACALLQPPGANDAASQPPLCPRPTTTDPHDSRIFSPRSLDLVPSCPFVAGCLPFPGLHPCRPCLPPSTLVPSTTAPSVYRWHVAFFSTDAGLECPLRFTLLVAGG